MKRFAAAIPLFLLRTALIAIDRPARAAISKLDLWWHRLYWWTNK